jgi:hypothetical protein
LSQFTTGQDRYLFLRCLVNGDKPEIARVNVDYKDELSDGSDQSASGVAKIDFTDDAKLSEKSANGAVVAQKELMLTAVAKDEAMSQADAGNYKLAAGTLSAQNAELDKVYADASAAVQEQIRQETNYLQTFSGAIGGGQFDSATRKVMQSQSYNTRNSKVQ